MNEPVTAVIFIVSGAGMATIAWLAFWVYEMKKQIADRDAKIEKMQTAQRNHLPYATAESIEHAMAGLLLIEQQKNDDRLLLNNVMEHLRKGRENKTLVP